MRVLRCGVVWGVLWGEKGVVDVGDVECGWCGMGAGDRLRRQCVESVHGALTRYEGKSVWVRSVE